MAEFTAGVCSVTLRGEPTRTVVRLSAASGLAGIEWGSDVHVRLDTPGLAQEVSAVTKRAGLRTLSLGSYFRSEEQQGFDSVLATAVELGAPRVRVWAGSRSSADADPSYREKIIRVLRECSRAAADVGLTIGLEYHGGTLTDSASSTADLMDAVDHDALWTYWQPPVGMRNEDSLSELSSIRERVCAVHVFSWWPERERLALSDRDALWTSALRLLAKQERPIDLLLEFVRGDDPVQMQLDAKTLLDWTNHL